ncbi:MAG: F0F1 ATP synthase subunit delta [bacterium]|nr:F0F1 ATP synthase subunit delta [bacterium]
MPPAPRVFAKALLVALEEAPLGRHEELLRNFKALLDRRGLRAKAHKVAEELEREAVKANQGRLIRIESAHSLDRETLDSLTKRFQPEDKVRTAVVPELTAGIILKVDGEIVIDASLKRKLRKLFA